MKIANPDKLMFFRDLYEKARAAMEKEYADMEKWLAQYKGSSEIDASDDVDGLGDAVRAKYVRNITYELIESQGSSYIPAPSVAPQMWSERNDRNAKSITTMLKNARDRLPFEEMNDIDERHSPIYGGSVWLVEWDESIVKHNTVGDVRVSCIPPNRFVGQPSIYNVQDMEYCFVTFETTKDEIERRYDVPKSKLDTTYTEDGDNEETATLYVCFYKDDDGHVCEYTWSGDAELSDVEDFYSRKKEVCAVCGKRKELCTCEEEGKKPSYETQDDEYEVLTHDIKLSDGHVLYAKCPKMENGVVVTQTLFTDALAPDGSMINNNVGGMMLPAQKANPIPVMEETKIPWYKPSLLPIVIRKNTSAENKLFGQSDCEVIRHQQQAINKIESRIMEKLLKAGVIPVLPEEAEVDMDNSILDRVIRIRREDAGLYDKLDLTPDISRDIAMAERVYDQAKRILGISDSFQGQYDGSAQSGVAKQLQIQQSAGRLNSKRQLKNAAYADIDRIIFQFMLAYADEPRPATYIDAYGRRQNCEFNRYDFVERDESGAWYYNDEYLFSADASADAEKDKQFLWQEARVNFQSGAYGDPSLPQTLLIFWLNMERAGYPNARENVERIQEEIRRQEETMMLQQQAQMAQQEAEGLRQELVQHQGYEGYLMNQIANGGSVNG